MIFPNIKIERLSDGKWYVLEITQKRTFFKREKCRHLVFYSGTDRPFGYVSFENALKDYLKEFEYSIKINSKY